MPVVQLNHTRLHTQVLGDGGPLIFMLHGLVSGSIATWYFNYAPALARHYRVVLFDLRGHGKSERSTSGYDLHTMASDLRELINHYCDAYPDAESRVHLVGHSFGALVALYYSAHCREMDAIRPQSLVVVDAPLPASRFVSPGMQRVVDAETVSGLAADLCEQLSIDGERRRRKIRTDLEFLYLQTTMKEDIAESVDIDDQRLAAMDFPVSLVYGESSDCVEVANRLQRLLPLSRLSILPCGHYVTVEQPQALAHLINDHFGEFMHG